MSGMVEHREKSTRDDDKKVMKQLAMASGQGNATTRLGMTGKS